MIYRCAILLYLILSFFCSIDAQEGFYPTTLIATLSGYRTVADMCVGDPIYYHNFQEKIVTNTLETEICDVQIAIGLFVDQIVSAKNETVCKYNTYTEKNAVGMNKQSYFNGTNYTQAASFYEYVIICSTYMDLIEKRNKECSVLVEFFKKYGQSQFLLQTTTILPSLSEVAKSVTESNKITDQTKKDLKVHLQSVHDYFYKTAAAPNISHKIQALHKDLQLTIQKKSKPQTFAYPKKPENNNDDDDDREVPRIYVNAKYHSQYGNSTKSPAPKNGQSALDNSLRVRPRARIAVDNNQIVILKMTQLLPVRGSEWHGYVVN